MGISRVNLELKARDADPTRSLATCEGLGAVDRGTLLQEDTYFSVTRGRLKLRREGGAVAHLIAYERADLAEQRESHYRIIEIGNDLELEAALVATLGVAAIVKKRRRLFLLDGVRIHLDQVDELGDFIEFEALAQADNDLARFQTLLSDLRTSFEIEDADLVSESYGDLILAAAEPGVR